VGGHKTGQLLKDGKTNGGKKAEQSERLNILTLNCYNELTHTRPRGRVREQPWQIKKGQPKTMKITWNPQENGKREKNETADS